MIGIIAATSINGVIGVYENGVGKLPFNYPDDMRHFKNMTKDSVVIMGRKTFESIGKPLPKRENVVITSKNLGIPNVRCHTSVERALRSEIIKIRDRVPNIWFIGGASIYQDAMLYANEIHLTLTPDYIDEKNAVKFPFINPLMFELCGYTQLSDPNKENLVSAMYTRKKTNNYYENVINQIKMLRSKNN